MRNASFSLTCGKFNTFGYMTVLLLTMSFSKTLFAGQMGADKPSQAEVIQKTKKLQIPFIANMGQTDERVEFYANTFGGTVFVTKDGEIVYSLPGRDEGQETRFCGLRSGVRKTGYGPQVNGNVIQPKSKIFDLFLISCFDPIPKIVSQNADYTFSQSKIQTPKSEIRGLALKETLIGGKVNKIKGEGKAITKVNYFKRKDASRWKTNISTYEVINLGEVYKGIDLKLRAYGNNVEKLFYVKPGASPDQIKISLSGINSSNPLSLKGDTGGLKVNEDGELVVETELGPVKFTKPVAYQEIDGKRVDVAVEYRIQHTEANLSNPKSEVQNPQSEYGFKVASYDKTKELIIDPLLASTYLGESQWDSVHSIAIDSDGNIYVTGSTASLNFPITLGVYDTSFNGTGDVFISKLNWNLTSILASTFLGGSRSDSASSITIDSSGDIYVAGYTWSSDFPTTPGTYDSSYNNSGYYDIFVSKLKGDLSSLLASTYLGGSAYNYGNAIAIDPSGNVYVTGGTLSSDFPISTDAYDTSFDGGSDIFISKFNSGLTTLLASTYLGGSSNESAYSMTIDLDGNIYVAGDTQSSDFPTSTTAYDTSFNGSNDVFIAKLSRDLTRLLASTYLGSSSGDTAHSITMTSGKSNNVYVTGLAGSADFPITTDTYDTSFNGNGDVFVSRLSDDLTTLLASTFLGGSSSDYANAIAIDSSGNVYVTGLTESSNFPTTLDASFGAYDIFFNGSADAFVSKFSGNLANLIASTFLGGYSEEQSFAIAMNSGDNVYVTGSTASMNFPTTIDAYDTSHSYEGLDAFISFFDSNLSASPPNVITGFASNVTYDSALLNGTVNANGLAATSWYEYGTTSGSYSSTSSTQTVSGLSDTSVSINISGLSALTIYYYRIVAQSSTGITYGSENNFKTAILPTPTPSPTPCEVANIVTSPKTLKLGREETGKITVLVTCADGSPVVNTVTATVKSGKKRISVTPLSQDTDTNGEAVFTITATQKAGKTKVEFESAGLKTIVTVKVKNK
ncbi:MAG: hypothetical protein DYG83_13515 [Candidatus Brocadia sp. AMX2]|uniref:Protein with FOG domain and PKD repeat n=1 Tax=Candidatus Brocadia sinica JPN1 TaxID=1197129 RepID=A0ABQ0JZ94_9BACT|nr:MULTISPECIES: SBBP repeat-containing protein [Brocadia]MBC6932265.1 hypothetical protein [Candidatus Brocadia sp.]MBL1168537.1 hypothetical protein [Candidatus Brocadia sp. AMX1]NOG40177.1 hypothetical protein [Planctomycetota bacterium]GIK14263.1 MAG: hypothetical protein BroJett002_29700 [Candidatus Brocadia sinica]KAA0243701.1 MAG: hypothetical protein EDM70_09745 [Candidatus Brocadia sp. AMX2]